MRRALDLPADAGRPVAGLVEGDRAAPARRGRARSSAPTTRPPPWSTAPQRVAPDQPAKRGGKAQQDRLDEQRPGDGARPSATSGSHTDSRPSGSRSGASREPATAPIASPASESTCSVIPRAAPSSAHSATQASTSQSSGAHGRGARVGRAPILGRVAADAPMSVMIWSDFVCPFCNVARERAAYLQREAGARIEWLPYDLHPEYPPEGIPREELVRRYGASF